MLLVVQLESIIRKQNTTTVLPAPSAALHIIPGEHLAFSRYSFDTVRVSTAQSRLAILMIHERTILLLLMLMLMGMP